MLFRYNYSLDEFDGQPVRFANRDRGETVDVPQRLEGGRYDVTNTLRSFLRIDNVRNVHYQTLFRCNAANQYGEHTLYFRYRECIMDHRLFHSIVLANRHSCLCLFDPSRCLDVDKK